MFYCTKPMNKFPLLLLLLWTATARGQKSPEVKAVLDSVIAHTERASLYRNKVDWPSLRAEVYQLANGADSIQKLVPAVKHLFTALGDEHARLMYRNEQIAYYYGEPKEHLKLFKPEIYNRIQSGQEFTFRAEMIGERTGYVRIVGLPMGDNLAMSKAIQDPILELQRKGAENWIIDLRYDGGGNMFPMVEGLATVIGDGMAGGTSGLTETESGVWKVMNGDFFYDDYSVALPNDQVPVALPKVAVLTSMYTVSSGEVVAVVFKGRESTRFFGEPTGGLTTANDWTPLGESTALMVSTSVYKDRNGKVYTDFVDVDENVEFVPGQELNEDKAITRATEWLNGQ